MPPPKPSLAAVSKVWPAAATPSLIVRPEMATCAARRDLERPPLVVAIDRQLPGPGPLNGQVLVDQQLDRDGVGRVPAVTQPQVGDLAADEFGGEDDGVAALGEGDLIAQRAEADGVAVGDGQRAGHDAALEHFQLRPKTRGGLAHRDTLRLPFVTNLCWLARKTVAWVAPFGDWPAIECQCHSSGHADRAHGRSGGWISPSPRGHLQTRSTAPCEFCRRIGSRNRELFPELLLHSQHFFRLVAETAEFGGVPRSLG